MSLGPDKTVVIGPPEASAALLDQLRQSLEHHSGRSPETIADQFRCPQPDPPPAGAEPGAPAAGPYVLERIIAQGGMGAVISAHDRNLRRNVALKVVLDGARASPENIQRLVSEARILGQLEHPNIVPLHELAATRDGIVYYTMRQLEGTTLNDVLNRIRARHPETVGRFNLATLLTVFQKVCDAVAYAHFRGVVHRDLKPDNIMLGEFGEVMVMDWGLAKLLALPDTDEGGQGLAGTGADDEGWKTQAGQVKGTPRYMAPEQAEGRTDDIDERTDIYALGAILYSILTLHPPVDGDTMDEVLKKVASGVITIPTHFNTRGSGRTRTLPAAGAPKDISPPILLHCPDRKIPAALSAVAMKALAREKDDRYQSTADLQEDIKAYQNGFATRAERAGAFTLLWLLIKRHKIEFSLAAGALLALLVVVVTFTTRITRALNELKQAAPSFYAEARALVDEIKFARAMQRINYALSLTPDNARFHSLKGDIHQSMFHFADAVADYERALELDPALPYAGSNLELSRRLRDERERDGAPSARSLADLRQAMQRQNRRAEMIALARHLSRNPEELHSAWAAIINRADYRGQLRPLPNGGLALEIRNPEANDLSPLGGMTLTELSAANTQVADLSPLAGLPLQSLNLARTRVTTLAPLKGMRLTTLNLEGTRLGDYYQIGGLPLQDLNLASTSITDLEPLRKLPLRSLRLDGCTNVINLTPLSGCTNLEQIVLPPHATNAELVLRLPRLKRVGTNWPVRGWSEVPARAASGG